MIKKKYLVATELTDQHISKRFLKNYIDIQEANGYSMALDTIRTTSHNA